MQLSRISLLIPSMALMVVMRLTPAIGATNDILWIKNAVLPVNSKHIVADGAGNVIVTGWGGDRVELSKYDGDGARLWSRELKVHNRGTDEEDIALGRDGSAYIAGWYHEPGAPGNLVSIIAKFGPKGGHQWTRKLPRNSGVWMQSIAVGPRDGVYAAGPYIDSPGSFVKKYKTDGRFLWSRRIPWGSLYDVEVASDGSVYIVGQDFQVRGDISPIALRKYGSNGQLHWARRIKMREYSSGWYRLAVDRAGGVVIASIYDSDKTFVTKYTPKGSRLWTRVWSDRETRDAVIDDDRNIYIVGAGINGRVFARKYGPQGSVRWTRYFITGEALSATVDSDANLYVVGRKLIHDTPSFFAKFSR